MKPRLLPTLANGLLLTPLLATSCWQSRRAELPQRAKHIDATTLAHWLNIEPAAIRSVQWQPVHRGTTSRSRLLVEYHDAQHPLPKSFFIKTTATTFSTRLFGSLFALGEHELAFYRSVRPQLTIRAPQVYHCEGDGNDFLLLLEDLGAAGAEFSDASNRCTLERAQAVLSTLAALHAQFWQCPQFERDLQWIPRHETARQQRLLCLLRELSVSQAMQKYRELVPDEIRCAAPLILEKYPLLERAWAREPRTLVHGDAHIGNMFFLNGEAGLLDWQVLNFGQGMRDVSYFLVNSVPTELRQTQQEALIRHYLAALAQHGIALPFDEAWQQYRLHTAYTWISSVVTAAGQHMQERKIAAAGLARTCRALLELDTISLLRAL